MRRALSALLITMAALTQAACLVSVERVADPAAAFRAARAEAARHHGRRGPAHQLNVLVYEPGDQEMLRLQIPMWLVKKLDGARDDHDWADTDDRGDQVARRLRRHLGKDALRKAPPGLLIEVDEEDGERVLVWLR